MHIKKCLQDIKFYIKRVVQENNKKGKTEGLVFRRHKFYDLTLTVFAMILSIIAAIGPQRVMAGNDPGIIGGDRSQSSLIAPLTVDQVIQSIDWSKSMFWQDYTASVFDLDGNDPGRQMSRGAANPWIVPAPGSVDFSGFLPEQHRVFIPSIHEPQCSFQLQYAVGDLKSVTLPCLGDVKFATESVCGVFGQPEYCDVAARAANILRQYKKE